MTKSDKRFIEKIRTKVSKAISDYGLINDEDTIVVGVSGGKDSMALLDILSNRRLSSPVKYHLVAVHIQLTDVPYYTDAQYLKEFCERRNIDFELIKDNTKIIIEGKQPCFYCAWNRRKLLFEYTAQNNFQKIAMGHHKDDVVETLLMNMIQHGEFSSFPVKLRMFDNRFELIRPLIYVSDKELQRYISIIGYKPLPYDCKYAELNKRETYKKLLKNLYQINRQATDNIFKSMRNIDKKHLP
jgi:tRNA(Ile)-lysidine synthase TilS/MesJ